jgi:hypothetical protein
MLGILAFWGHLEPLHFHEIGIETMNLGHIGFFDTLLSYFTRMKAILAPVAQPEGFQARGPRGLSAGPYPPRHRLPRPQCGIGCAASAASAAPWRPRPPRSRSRQTALRLQTGAFRAWCRSASVRAGASRIRTSSTISWRIARPTNIHICLSCLVEKVMPQPLLYIDV